MSPCCWPSVNAEGKREILGVDVVTTEAGAGWLALMRDSGDRRGTKVAAKLARAVMTCRTKAGRKFFSETLGLQGPCERKAVIGYEHTRQPLSACPSCLALEDVRDLVDGAAQRVQEDAYCAGSVRLDDVHGFAPFDATLKCRAKTAKVAAAGQIYDRPGCEAVARAKFAKVEQALVACAPCLDGRSGPLASTLAIFLEHFSTARVPQPFP